MFIIHCFIYSIWTYAFICFFIFFDNINVSYNTVGTAGTATAGTLNEAIADLEKKRDKCGIFKSKEKKAIQERIDAVKKAIENYDATNTLIKDLDTEIQGSIYKW